MIIFTLNFQNAEVLGFKMAMRIVKVRMVYKQEKILSSYDIVSSKRQINVFFKRKSSSGRKKDYLYV